MRYWKTGMAVAACAACCAPLIAPVFMGTAALGAGAAGASYFGSLELGAIVLALGLVGLWFYRRSRKPAKGQCNCLPDSGCNAGASCTLPPRNHISAG